MTDGYLYCFSNESMPGILKVGGTDKTPEIILNEANVLNTWGQPSPYKIQFAKRVSNLKEKETALHKLLSHYTERINESEFFRVPVENVETFFELTDGDLWVPRFKEAIISKQALGCRDMTKCFINGQRIRHMIGNNKIWIGTYDSAKNGIVHNETFYKSLSGFAETHYSKDKSGKFRSANGWAECHCEKDGKWISTHNL